VSASGEAGWRLVRLVAVIGVGLVAITSARRLGPTGRGWLAMGAGVLSFTVGVAIGGPHVAKTGLTPMSVAGVINLVAGVVLLVTGGSLLLRGRRWWARALAVPAAVVIVVLALLTLGQALVATNVPATEVGSRSPADRGLDYEEVEARTADGVTLAAWYVPSTNGAAVVLRHGAGSTRADTLDQAEVLAAHGYGVLLMDARGHGDSGGRAMDFGWYGDLDIGAGVDLLAARPDVEDGRIAVVGLSMGGEEAVGAAAADPRIRAVVAEGVGQRVAADKAWLSEEYGVRGAVQEQIERATFGLTDLLTDADPPVPLREAVAAASPRPVLLVAAGDVPEEAGAARHIHGGAPDSVEVWVVPGAAHTGGLDTQPGEWEERVTAFLAAALGVHDVADGSAR
jgi:pimeloyl-ACP methyl ester carboxylesterase